MDTITNDLQYVPRIETEEDHITVRTAVVGIPLDRPDLQGYAVRDLKTAERLASAIRAGVVFHSPKVLTDVNGKTYLGVSSRVLGRLMNADLKRLGF